MTYNLVGDSQKALDEMQERLKGMSRDERNRRMKELRRGHKAGLPMLHAVELIALERRLTPNQALDVLVSEMRSGAVQATGYKQVAH